VDFLHALAQANILHFAVGILVKGLVICLLVRVLLSWVLRGQENGVTRFFNNVTAPLVAPFERLIPPISIGGISFSIGFIVAWWSTVAVGALLSQALPAGW
jgi:uncharacterized protein YggT (Ycf19 family)